MKAISDKLRARLCPCLLELVEIFEKHNLTTDLNDGYSDWIVCKKHKVWLRLYQDGSNHEPTLPGKAINDESIKAPIFDAVGGPT